MSVNAPLLSDRGLVFSSEFTSLLKKYPVPVEIYIVGSSSNKQFGHFNQVLSDIDLMITPDPQSFDEYVAGLSSARQISVMLNSEPGQLVDVFILNSRLADRYFACLSAIWGFNQLDRNDLVYGTFAQDHNPLSPAIDARHRKALYVSKAAYFCNQLAHDLPQADASNARKIAKDIVKCLKVTACALASVESLDNVERGVFATKDFQKVLAQLDSGQDDWAELAAGLQKIINEGRVEDWPDWMMLQDASARLLLEYVPRLKQQMTDDRFYAALWQVWDMLTKGVKDVLLTDGEELFPAAISEFADRVTGVIVKLGLAGVEELIDFETNDTPSDIKRAYRLIVDHLQADDLNRGDLPLLGAAVVLLEYAFTAAVKSDAR
jgi:hypothetical protein